MKETKEKGRKIKKAEKPVEHIVFVSGGKDSTALLLRMIELDYPLDEIIFADTGTEFQETYDYLAKIEKVIGRKITVLKATRTFDDWFYGKFSRGKKEGERRGFPFVVSSCWWKRESKEKPVVRHLRGRNIVRYVGYAADERSATRKDIIARYKEGKGDAGVKYPLVDWGWTEKDCKDYLDKKGLLNPLYSRFKRTGCWLCPYQPKSSLKIVFDHYKQYWARIKKYEKDSPHGFHPEYTTDELEKQFSDPNWKPWKKEKILCSECLGTP